ncbi:MAG: right-handed parallel beta-helix repeat-containing protein [Prevotellaceae bacterium]|nr:right-handed parallel beta-helix repeat-containing protein [Candidatus Minthosoma caballi]
MKRSIFTLSLLMLLSLTAFAQKKKEIKVNTAEELLYALRSDASTIVITAKEAINLTETLDRWYNSGKLQEETIAEGVAQSDIFVNDDEDGLGLVMIGLKNITIKGKSPKKPAEIVIDPRFPDVLKMDHCENITLENLVLGHTVQGDMGWCHGDVLALVGCKNTTVRNCSLFGCGVCGIEASNISNLLVENTEIHHCSWDAIHIHGRNVTFNNCDFHHNAGFMLINVETSNVTFNGCTLRNTNGTLFDEYSIYNPITMNKCKIIHHEGLGSKMDLVKIINCDVQIDEEGEPDGYSPLGGEVYDDEGEEMEDYGEVQEGNCDYYDDGE